MIIERKLKETMNEKENELKKINNNLKNPKIIKKKIQKCEIFLYNSSLRAEATCEFY